MVRPPFTIFPGWVALPFVLLVALLIMPTARAGSEGEPEVSSPPGGVHYSQAYLGERNHEYLDLLAAWLEYRVTTDEFHLTIKIGSSQGLAPQPGIVRIAFASVVYIETELQGSLLFTYRSDAEGQEPLVRFFKEDTAATTAQPLTSTFSLIEGSPAYLRFGVPRNQLLQLGETIESMNLSATEEIATGPLVTGEITNSEYASSSAFFSFIGSAPQPSTSGPNVSTDSSRAADPIRGGEAPTFGVLQVSIVIGAAAVALNWRPRL